MGNWETQLRKGLVELAVLGLIARGETYGYRIVDQLQGREALALTESTVYPLLVRLAREGCLVVRSEPSKAGPVRRYYRLTAAGARRFRAMVETWESVSRSISGILEFQGEHMEEGRDEDDRRVGDGAEGGEPAEVD